MDESDIPDKIRFAAQRLREGHRMNRITVRDFLRHFGAERRGAVKVQAIRAVLDSLGLETDPDFETAWIDSPVWLRLKDGALAENHDTSLNGAQGSQAEEDLHEMILEGTPSAVQQAEEQLESAPTSPEPEGSKGVQDVEGTPTEDPAFRIGALPAANKKLVVTDRNDSLAKAVTLMLQHDFSQLPVMQGEREVKGMISWKSIGSKLALGCKCEKVSDCLEDASIVDSSRPLFDAIQAIVEHGYVLVRNHDDRRITGMVTASDLSLQFQALSEPFLLLREIELHVRQLLQHKLTNTDFDVLDSPPPSIHKPQNVADLTFGQYARLFQHPKIWAKLNLKIDAGVLTTLLEAIRDIRNDVMHFDPDPMTADELYTLKRAVRFMQELDNLLPKG
jgi:CBS domain-containing protein